MLGYDAGASGSPVGEYDSAGNLIQETVWLGDIPVATIQPSGSSVAIYYVVTDQLDTPREVIRPSDNAVMWSWFTGPFGVEAPNTNPQGAGTFTYDLRFPGQIAGTWGSTLQNDNRDYDPAVDRYVESDPIGLAGGSYSTYIYCAANPLTKTDSSGEGFIDCAKALAELQAATLNVELRLADIVRCGNKPDPGHIKALKQAVNRLQNAYDAVFKHCGSYIGAAAALAIAAEVLAEAAAVLAGA